MGRCCVWIVLVACATTRPPAVHAPKLAPGAPVEREIAEGQTHQYEVTLAADTVLFAEIDQLGADVTTGTFGHDGTQLSSADGTPGGKGTEHVRIDAKQAGTYRIDVGAAPGQLGKYRVRVVEIVPAK